MQIPVNSPLITPEDIAAVVAALEDGWISGDGPVVSDFEEAMAASVGRKHGISVSNGTVAIDIAISALAFQKGDEIIVPSFTIISVINQILREGLVPRFVDCDPLTWNMNTDEVEGLIRNTVKSCAALYGFSAEEALAKIDLNGNLISVVKANVDKEAEKAEKLRLKEAEKAEKAEKLRLKEAEKALKEAEKTEKANESSENSAMKEQEVLSKAAEKLRVKEAEKALKEAEKALKKSEKPAKKVKKVKNIKVDDDDSDVSTVIMSASEDEEPHVLFQNIPLINEINSIRDVKKFKNFKKLSAGVKLARQILDI